VRRKRHRIAGPNPVPLERFAATPDLRDGITAWQTWLADERRCSPHTLAAYGLDLAAFLKFLAGHLGATEVDPIGGTTGTGLLVGSSAVPIC
jgi:Phage integrase, N-terminal SAM-like domain